MQSAFKPATFAGRADARREKLYGNARGLPLDRNAKARVMAWVRGYNARHRAPGQHRGPITHAVERVLRALVWGFHNARDGRCFPSYEAIAERAECGRSTVAAALVLLEAIGLLSWANRFVKLRIDGRWRVLRTSNAYVIRDPLPCAARPEPSTSENPSGTKFQNSQREAVPVSPAKFFVLDPASGLDAALLKLGRAIGAIPGAA